MSGCWHQSQRVRSDLRGSSGLSGCGLEKRAQDKSTQVQLHIMADVREIPIRGSMSIRNMEY